MAVTLNTQSNVFNEMRNSNVNYSGATSFKANEEKPVMTQTQDEVITQEPKKKSIIRKFKDGFSSIKKFFIGIGEYTKGAVKGLLYGGIAASSIIGIDAVKGATRIIKDAKAGNLISNGAKEAVKVLSTKGKIVAGTVGLGVMAYQLFQASLNASEKKAGVDHRWGSGHNQS
jgi:hypothetical protein